MLRKRVFQKLRCIKYVLEIGSGGGTRTPDTRIMIKLLKLFLFKFSCLKVRELGVLKSV